MRKLSKKWVSTLKDQLDFVDAEILRRTERLGKTNDGTGWNGTRYASYMNLVNEIAVLREIGESLHRLKDLES